MSPATTDGNGHSQLLGGDRHCETTELVRRLGLAIASSSDYLVGFKYEALTRKPAVSSMIIYTFFASVLWNIPS